ncbi:MAG: hypothetical protein ACXVAK_02770 [Vulcanimicrobiaceae bacterium]
MMSRLCGVLLCGVALLALAGRARAQTPPAATPAPTATVQFTSEDKPLPAVGDTIAYRGLSPLHISVSNVPDGTVVTAVVDGSLGAASCTTAHGICAFDIQPPMERATSTLAVMTGQTVAAKRTLLDIGGLQVDSLSSDTMPGAIVASLKLPGTLGHLRVSHLQIDDAGHPSLAHVESVGDDPDVQVDGSLDLTGAYAALAGTVELPANLSPSGALHFDSMMLTPRGITSSALTDATITIGGLRFTLANATFQTEPGNNEFSAGNLAIALDASASPGGDVIGTIGAVGLRVSTAGGRGLRFERTGAFVANRLQIGPFVAQQIAAAFDVLPNGDPRLRFSGVVSLPAGLAGNSECGTPSFSFTNIEVADGQLVGDDGKIGTPKTLSTTPVQATVGGLCAHLDRVQLATATNALQLAGSLDLPEWLGTGGLATRLDLAYDEGGAAIKLVHSSVDASRAAFYFGRAKNVTFSFPSLDAITLSGAIALPDAFGGAQIEVPGLTFSRNGIAVDNSTSTPGIAHGTDVNGRFLGVPALLHDVALRYVSDGKSAPHFQVTLDGGLRLPVTSDASAMVYFTGAAFALGKSGVHVDDEPQWKLPQAPLALHAFGMALDFQSPKCTQPIAMLTDAHGASDGIGLCARLHFPKQFGVSLDQAPCVVLDDLEFHKDGRVSVSGLTDDGQCSRRFQLTRLFSLNLDSISFTRPTASEPYRLSANIAVTQDDPLPLFRGQRLTAAEFSIDSSEGDTILHGHVYLHNGVQIGRIGWNVNELEVDDDRSGFTFKAAGGIRLPLMHGPAIYVRDVGFHVERGHRAKPLVPHIDARATIIGFIENALTSHWSSMLLRAALAL